ncbi:MAG: crossover junction endodeoxyribonuclease RuvC [Verrucomicrobiota bacterium]
MGISPKDFENLQGRLAGRRTSVQSRAADLTAPLPVRRILGIDPSLRGTGLGVISFEGVQPAVVHQETIRCPASWLRTRCLGQIASVVREVVRNHRPEVCVVEGLFFAQNLKTALTMGEARGAAIAAVAEADVPVYEMAPRKVKLAIVGFGAAQKLAVAKMVQRLLALENLPDPDAADALALGLAFAHEARRVTGSSRQRL